MEMFDLANLDPKEYGMGVVSPQAGKACLDYLDFSISQVMDAQADAIVFAPLNKPGHESGEPRIQK